MSVKTVFTIIFYSLSFFVSVHFLGALRTLYNMPPSVANAQGETLNLVVRPSFDPISSTLTITVDNKSSDRTFTLLTWDTPLDPQALNLGALTLEDATSGALIPGPNMKINRRLPPSGDALVEVTPGASATKDVNTSLPWFPRDGKLYRVRVQGSWKAVWAKPLAEITDQELERLEGDVTADVSIQSESTEMRLEQ